MGLKGWLTPRNLQPSRSGWFRPGWLSLSTMNYYFHCGRQSCSDLQTCSLALSGWLEAGFQHSMSTRWQVALLWASKWTIFCLKLQLFLCSRIFLERFVEHTPMPWIYISFIDIPCTKNTSQCWIQLCFTAILVIFRISRFSLELSLAEAIMKLCLPTNTIPVCKVSFFFPISKIIGCIMPHTSNTAKPRNPLPRLMSLSTKEGKKTGREKRKEAAAVV